MLKSRIANRQPKTTASPHSRATRSNARRLAIETMEHRFMLSIAPQSAPDTNLAASLFSPDISGNVAPITVAPTTGDGGLISLSTSGPTSASVGVLIPGGPLVVTNGFPGPVVSVSDGLVTGEIHPALIRFPDAFRSPLPNEPLKNPDINPPTQEQSRGGAISLEPILKPVGWNSVPDANSAMESKMVDGALDRMIGQGGFTSNLPAVESKISGEWARATIFEMAGGETGNSAAVPAHKQHQLRGATADDSESNLEISVSSDSKPQTPAPSLTHGATDDQTYRCTRSFIESDANSEIAGHWNATDVDRSIFLERYEHGFCHSLNIMFLKPVTQINEADASKAQNAPAADGISQSASDPFEHSGKKAGPVATLFAKISPKDAALDAAPFLIALSLEHLANRKTQRADKNARAQVMRRPK
jgi:hypothetical protein